MRYRLAALMLFLVLPVMNVLAAPAPEPSGILEIGRTPPEGWTVEQYLNEQIKFMTSFNAILDKVCSDPEVKKLPSVASLKDARSWLAKNIRGTPEKGSHLRFTFRAGKRPEQVTIINAFFRAELSVDKEFIKSHEEDLRRYEIYISKLESKRNPTDNDRNEIHNLRTYRIPRLRTEIARLKQTKVIRWAK